MLVGLESCQKISSSTLRGWSILSPANSSESRGDRAADPESHKRILRRRPPHNRCRMGIASTASYGIPNRLDEHRQKELKSLDRRGLSRESNCQLPSRTIHRIVHPTRGLLPRPRVLRHSWFRASYTGSELVQSKKLCFSALGPRLPVSQNILMPIRGGYLLTGAIEGIPKLVHRLKPFGH
jgi:hypothetical protein